MAALLPVQAVSRKTQHMTVRVLRQTLCGFNVQYPVWSLTSILSADSRKVVWFPYMRAFTAFRQPPFLRYYPCTCFGPLNAALPACLLYVHSRSIGLRVCPFPKTCQDATRSLTEKFGDTREVNNSFLCLCLCFVGSIFM